MKPHTTFAASFVLSFLACLPMIGYASPAFAQSINAAVDLAPLAMNGITILGTIALAVGGVISRFVIGWLSSKTEIHNVQLENMAIDRVNAGLGNAINYATTIAKAWVADPAHSQYLKVEFNNIFVSSAVQYMLDHYAESILKLKLSPEKIADMVRSRIAPYLANPVPNAGIVQTADAIDPIHRASVETVPTPILGG